MIEQLLEAGADVESPNADGQTALMVVARTGRVDAARAAARARRQRERGGAVARPDGADVGGRAEPAGDGAELLVAAGADVNARSTVNNWERQVTAEPRAMYRPAGGLTPLLYAAREGCVECATHARRGRRRDRTWPIRRTSARCSWRSSTGTSTSRPI